MKKLSVVVSSAPSTAPVLLLNVRIRPLTPTRNWVGPAAPIESGGMSPESLKVAPRKFVVTLWGARGCSIRSVVAAELLTLAADDDDLGVGRRRTGGAWRGPAAAPRLAMIWPTVSLVPMGPFQGVPFVVPEAGMAAAASPGDPEIRNAEMATIDATATLARLATASRSKLDKVFPPNLMLSDRVRNYRDSQARHVKHAVATLSASA